MNAVEFSKVSKHFKDFSLNDINISIPEGFVTGIVGPNGSGKTTIIEMMMNILHPDRGEISLYGNKNTDASIKQQFGFVYDDLYIYDHFTIRKMKSFIAPLYDTWNEALFVHYLERFNLPERRKIKTFSKGMKIKCSLLFALAHEPECIIMDEPTAGLDPIFRKELIQLLQELMVNEKQTIFISTHITTDLDQIADYIIFINQGEIISHHSKTDLQERFFLIKGTSDFLDADTRSLFTGLLETESGFTALYDGELGLFENIDNDILIETASIEDVLYFKVKEDA
ncbi:MAG TPA: ABC transporter ATP-binding protein [Bacillota bacterium]|nr:ABC transporter ATP-binding protein [Bacillota bacterium]